MKKLLLIILFAFIILNVAKSQNAWINEFHYDNTGKDTGEFIEIVIENTGSYTLSDFRIDLYNGGNGTSYRSKTVDKFTKGNTEGSYTFYYWDVSGIQNGAPDGFSLSYNGALVSGQFLSYEGSFVATNGPANGETSVDVGVSETSSTPTGYSLQLAGTGLQYSNFIWQNPAISTKGRLNNNQILGSGSTGPGNPTIFTASVASISEIDLSWTQNGNGNNVMVVWNSTNTFGTPADGTTYAAGDSISGGGIVLYNGNATSCSHTSLTSDTHYYYKAWSVDGTANYSGGVTANAGTHKKEPTNHVTGFSAAAAGSSQINLSWTENDGIVIPDGYLIIADTGTVANPTDGTDPTNDTNLTDGSGNIKVTHGTTSYSFTNCGAATTYHFKIYPYTNSGSAISFKTNGSVPSASATTNASAAEPGVGDLKISEVNSTAATNATYVEIYNTTTNVLSLGKVDLEHYNNGAATASAILHLTGSVVAHGYIIIARVASEFNTVYGFNPDFELSNMYLNGGEDGLILRHDNNGILDKFNNAPSATVFWTNKHLFYRFNYSGDGSNLANDWDDAGLDRKGTPRAKNELVWQTTGTTDWRTGSNWSNGDIPSKGVDVVISSGGTQPSAHGTATNPATCNNLIINAGATLTIPGAEYMTVYGNLSNNSDKTGLVIESTSSGNGSLIIKGTVAGKAIVGRRIAAYSPGKDNGWHEIGSPVNNMAISGSDFAPGANDDLYAWSETTNTWLNDKVSGNNITHLTNGNGFLVAYQAYSPKNFSGTLNNTDVSVLLSYTSGKGDGWNLLGNPFPSAIIWNNANWSLPTTVSGTAEVWNGRAGNYNAVLAGGIIPSTNGFFVQTSSATTLTIPAAARVHDGTNNHKMASVINQKETLTFKISEDTNTYSDKSILGFRPGATEDWDIAYDAHKLFSFIKTAPQIWTTSNGENFLVNYLPEVTTSYDVPLDFKAGVNAVYHLTIKGADSFENTSLVFEDLLTGEKINLSNENSYDFSAAKGDDVSRFILHVNGGTAVPSHNKTERVQVFAYGNTVYLHSPESLNGSVSIFNIFGQEIYTGSLNRRKSQKIHLNQKTDIYFVRVENDNKVIIKKVFIK